MTLLRFPVVMAALLVLGSANLNAKSRTLDIYFIDVEGGAATLIVTPLGESLLVDSGFPGERDPARIAHVALDLAGLKQIDHYSPEDKTDNAKSIGFVLTFGRFKFFDGGDLTWNVEHKLVCPENLPGVVDVYQVDHHGMDSSNNPEFIRALKPTVAIIDNGPRKAGEARTFGTLKSQTEIRAIYQLHRNVLTTEKDNAPPDFVANDEEACQGNFIKVSVDANGDYSVSIPAKGISRSYRAR